MLLTFIRASGPFFLVLLTLRTKIMCSFRVPGTNNLVAHHHSSEEKSANYTAVKTAQLTCKYIYIYICRVGHEKVAQVHSIA